MSTAPTVLVTGASRGIGQATAIKLAEYGYDVVITARSEKGLKETAAACEEHGRRTLTFAADVTDEGLVRGIIQSVVDAWGRLDALVNNAGGGGFTPLADVSTARWNQLVRLNLDQVYWATQAAGAVMRRQGGGAIVNVSSYAALRAVRGLAPYAASKAAVLALTQAAASEWGVHGIRVNAVAPGWIRTDLNQTIWEAEDGGANWVASSALRRFGEVDEVAEAIAFLVSPKASYITGHTLVVDGGLTI